MRLVSCALVMLVWFAGGLEAQYPTYWMKDYIRDANGGTIAIAVPAPPDTTAPSVPSIVSITPGATSAALVWTASTDNSGGGGLAGYRIYRGAALVGTAGAEATGFTDPALQPNTEYSYRVAAFDAAGNPSSPSAGNPSSPSAGNPSSPSSAATVTTLE